MEIDNLLGEREHKYGDFSLKATTIQWLKEIARRDAGWSSLPNDQKEAIDMIFTKIGRILTGKHTYKDNWTDIKGYARLVEERL